MSSRIRRTAPRILACWYRWSYLIRFLKTDMMEWNCSSFAGSIFGKSSETLLNLAMVCFAKRPNFKFGNAFSANFSSLKTRSTGTFVRPTISCPRHQNFIHDIQINKSRPWIASASSAEMRKFWENVVSWVIWECESRTWIWNCWSNKCFCWTRIIYGQHNIQWSNSTKFQKIYWILIRQSLSNLTPWYQFKKRMK